VGEKVRGICPAMALVKRYSGSDVLGPSYRDHPQPFLLWCRGSFQCDDMLISIWAAWSGTWPFIVAQYIHALSVDTMSKRDSGPNTSSAPPPPAIGVDGLDSDTCTFREPCPLASVSPKFTHLTPPAMYRIFLDQIKPVVQLPRKACVRQAR
jgi:hypothetical protein